MQVDIKALAQLSRLDLSDDELVKLEKEIPAILGFVETIQQVSSDMKKEESPEHRTIMRDDENPHESGIYSKALLDAAPAQRENQVVVQQVLSREK